MRFRIQQIIDRERMSAAQFADKVGIQRPTLSHVLNGRNNVSTEIISKIHATYPNISIEWLMFGEGLMFDENESQLSLFQPNENSIIEPMSTPTPKYSKDSELNNAVNTHNYIENKPVNPIMETIPPVPLKNKEVVKIMVFYSDNTYETFSQDINDKKGK